MKKSLIAMLAICSAVFAASVDIIIVNNTNNISSRPGCMLELVEGRETAMNSIMPGGEDKIHLKAMVGLYLVLPESTTYIAKCEGFDARVEVVMMGSEYYADIFSPGDQLSFIGSTGSTVTDKRVFTRLIWGNPIHRLVISQKK